MTVKSFGFALLTIALLAGLLSLSQYLMTTFPSRELWEYDAAELERMARTAAILHDIDAEIFIAQIRQESQFNQHARSEAGALGVAQIMPGTAKSWKVDPHNPIQALDSAAKAMAGFIRTYKAQGHDERTAYKLALAAYNAGPGAVAKYKGIPPYSQTQEYIDIILAGK